MPNKNGNEFNQFAAERGDAGFTLLEAVIAIFILTVGLVGTAAAITYALQFSAISQNVTKSKLLLMASIEEIETLRNARRLDFKQIANAGNVNNTNSVNPFGGFSTDFQAVSENPGRDGVFGTDDDFISAGADGTYGTPDDQPSQTIPQYSRRVIITEISKSIKKIQVTVRYPGRGGTIGQITGVSYLNNDARTTR